MEYGDSTLVAGNQRKLLERYSRISLLILDEWLVSDISDAELHFLFELMERRSDTTSTIFCTPVSYTHLLSCEAVPGDKKIL